MAVRDVEVLVREFYDRLWNQWDDEHVESILSDDFHFRGSLGQTTSGRRAWREYRDRVRSAAPDFHNEILEMIASGDRAAVRLRYTGTHAGHLLGHPPTGRRFSYEGTAFFTRTDDRLVRGWVLGDRAGLDEQLRQEPLTGTRESSRTAAR
ncbi:ester cyclase [uncultured Leifsonia sp.]|uniref:ester cyclase n=1 Tax=uncultured Leifsonia sp. TaxID=340359 RepID=UPI0025E1D199|nr:ester cyclase [uncultured Leifsonia sp.]